MTSAASLDRTKFAILRADRRIWAIGSIHGEAARLGALHDRMAQRLEPGDQIVYLGNYVGVGAQSRATIDEALELRRWRLARAAAMQCDIVFLRGAQEEMLSKLLQLQFAPNPREVLAWLLDHGVAHTLAAYGAAPDQATEAARGGPVAITRWTQSVRDQINLAPGHSQFFSSLRRAAVTSGETCLLVHAGIDPGRPLTAQADSFWWAALAFSRLDRRYGGFSRIVRGFDPARSGLVETPWSLSLDGGCGFGGRLIAVAIDPFGKLLDTIEI